MAVTQISRVTAWGNNSRQAYVDVRNAWIDGQPALEVIDDPAWVRKVLEPAVAVRGREILRVRGSSPAGSVARPFWGRFTRSRRRRHTSAGSMPPRFPTAATTFRAGWFSASRYRRRTAETGRSSRACMLTSMPASESRRMWRSLSTRRARYPNWWGTSAGEHLKAGRIVTPPAVGLRDRRLSNRRLAC